VGKSKKYNIRLNSTPTKCINEIHTITGLSISSQFEYRSTMTFITSFAVVAYLRASPIFLAQAQNSIYHRDYHRDSYSTVCRYNYQLQGTHNDINGIYNYNLHCWMTIRASNTCIESLKTTLHGTIFNQRLFATQWAAEPIKFHCIGNYRWISPYKYTMKLLVRVMFVHFAEIANKPLWICDNWWQGCLCK
jgi:hypothetical protein